MSKSILECKPVDGGYHVVVQCVSDADSNLACNQAFFIESAVDMDAGEVATAVTAKLAEVTDPENAESPTWGELMETRCDASGESKPADVVGAVGTEL